MSSSKNHFALLSQYNLSANQRLYENCSRLSDAERKTDRGAFFRSIHGTLNHIMVGDRIWMARFRGQTASSTGLDEILYEDFNELWDRRRALDQQIIRFLDGLDAEWLDSTIAYTNNEGRRFEDPVRLLLPHMFNHQTHHRGQVHDMICRTDLEPPVLDMHRVIKPEPDEDGSIQGSSKRT